VRSIDLRSTTDSADCDAMSVLPEWKVEDRERGMMDLDRRGGGGHGLQVTCYTSEILLPLS
jgi:hypothetical protein